MSSGYALTPRIPPPCALAAHSSPIRQHRKFRTSPGSAVFEPCSEPGPVATQETRSAVPGEPEPEPVSSREHG